MVSYEEKVATFKEQLDLIINDNIREFTKFCLSQSPEYVYNDCPSSSSGRHHPIDELSFDGNIIHTKKVFTVAYELCRGLDCEHHRDEILSACLLHDIVKQGKVKTGHTLKNHPALAAELVETVYEATKIIPVESYTIIRNSCGYHYGPWSTGGWKKPLDEYTKEELCVYISDYVASKRCVEVAYRR